MYGDDDYQYDCGHDDYCYDDNHDRFCDGYGFKFDDSHEHLVNHYLQFFISHFSAYQILFIIASVAFSNFAFPTFL